MNNVVFWLVYMVLMVVVTLLIVILCVPVLYIKAEINVTVCYLLGVFLWFIAKNVLYDVLSQWRKN